MDWSSSVASLPRLITALWDKDSRVQFDSLWYLRQIFFSVPCAQEIRSSNIVPRIVELLKWSHNPHIQFGAVSCLNVISSKCPHALFHHDALPVLVGLVSSPNYKISHEAICALGYVAISAPAMHEHVLSFGAFDPVVARLGELVSVGEPLMLHACSCTLANFCKGNKLNADQTGTALRAFKYLLEKQDDALVEIACWGIHDISDGGVQALIDTGIYSRLAYLLKNNYGNYTPSVLIPMLLTLLNILEEDDSEFTSSPKIMSDALMFILSHNDDKDLQKYVCNIILNLAVVSTTFIQCMLDNGTLDHLLLFLDMVAKRNTKVREARIKAESKNPKKAHEIRVDELKEVDETYEAALALSHMASNTNSDQIRELVKRGCIKQLCYLLSEQNSRQDPRVVASCLDGIHNMLNAGEVLKEPWVTSAFSVEDKKSIGDLCDHTIGGISARATTILRKIQ